MKYSYATKGVCATNIDVSIKDGLIEEVNFTRGCDGNLKGISSLVVGMEPEEAAKRLKGIKCGVKSSSCPEQLAFALEEIITSKK